MRDSSSTPRRQGGCRPGWGACWGRVDSSPAAPPTSTARRMRRTSSAVAAAAASTPTAPPSPPIVPIPSSRTRAGYSRADQFYASYPAGTELLTDTAKVNGTLLYQQQQQN